jgi:hypothetical protein
MKLWKSSFSHLPKNVVNWFHGYPKLYENIARDISKSPLKYHAARKFAPSPELFWSTMGGQVGILYQVEVLLTADSFVAATVTRKHCGLCI